MLLTETAWKTSEAERSCGWVFHRPEVKRAEPPTEPAAELTLGSAIQLWMESTGLSHPHLCPQCDIQLQNPSIHFCGMQRTPDLPRL